VTEVYRLDEAQDLGRACLYPLRLAWPLLAVCLQEILTCWADVADLSGVAEGPDPGHEFV
jgi:hypothetical protein